jgi:citrate synthase
MAITTTHKEPENENSAAMFGEHELLSYAAQVGFSELVFESLMGRVPTAAEAKLFSLILNLCFDHGPNSPSAVATISATKAGKGMGEAVGAGIAQINDSHGGAGESLMNILYGIIAGSLDARGIVTTYNSDGKKMPGFGHRVYKDVDPRAELLLRVARENNIGVECIGLVEKIKFEIGTQMGKDLPINIDGAIAAILCGMGASPRAGKAIFIVARSAGLCAHYINAM